MKYTLATQNGILYITFQGDLISAGESIELMDAINDHLHNGILKAIVDMKNVRYMNSSGIGILITLYTKFKNKNGNAVLANTSEQILKLLQLTKLDSVIRVFNTLDEAKTYV